MMGFSIGGWWCLKFLWWSQTDVVQVQQTDAIIKRLSLSPVMSVCYICVLTAVRVCIRLTVLIYCWLMVVGYQTEQTDTQISKRWILHTYKCALCIAFFYSLLHMKNDLDECSHLHSSSTDCISITQQMRDVWKTSTQTFKNTKQMFILVP